MSEDATFGVNDRITFRKEGTVRQAHLSGYLLLITGSLHTLLGVVRGYSQLLEMTRAGLVGTGNVSTERALTLWFLIAGVGIILMGLLALGYQEPLPAGFGWGLLALSLLGVLPFPTSGFWLLIPQALFVLVVAYR